MRLWRALGRIAWVDHWAISIGKILLVSSRFRRAIAWGARMSRKPDFAGKLDLLDEGCSTSGLHVGKPFRAREASSASFRGTKGDSGDLDMGSCRTSKQRSVHADSSSQDDRIKPEWEGAEHDNADGYRSDELAGAAGDMEASVDSDFKIFPRRKGGQSKKCAESAPVIITAELLQTCFDMPLVRAAKKLGICATALKKVCRKLGIHKWPYKEMKPSLSLSRQLDDDRTLPGAPAALSGAASADETCASTHRRQPGAIAAAKSASADKSASASNGRETVGPTLSPLGRRTAHRGNRALLRQATGGGGESGVGWAQGGTGNTEAEQDACSPISPAALQRRKHEFAAAENGEDLAGTEVGISGMLALSKLQELFPFGGKGGKVPDVSLGSRWQLEGQRQLPSMVLAAPPSSLSIPSMHSAQFSVGMSTSSKGGESVTNLDACPSSSQLSPAGAALSVRNGLRGELPHWSELVSPPRHSHLARAHDHSSIALLPTTQGLQAKTAAGAAHAHAHAHAGRDVNAAASSQGGHVPDGELLRVCV